MKDNETVDRFIELRAQNWSFNRIAAELYVLKTSKPKPPCTFCMPRVARTARVHPGEFVNPGV